MNCPPDAGAGTVLPRNPDRGLTERGIRHSLKELLMKDVLIITWHGIHELDIFPGLPDTGGQNIYVQNMAEKIHDQYECRVTILNRGGFVHPYTERMREGSLKDPERELYVLHVNDGVDAFLRKEFLTGALIQEGARRTVQQLSREYRPDLIISHFWDGGLMGLFLCDHFGKVPHVWVPHEPVGMKKAPMDAIDYDRHSIFLREHYEERIVARADLIGSTSKLVEEDIERCYNGNVADKLIDIYPGVDTRRFTPLDDDCLPGQSIREDAEFLALPESLFERPHICEFGRTDSLKDKDKAVEVFAKVAKEIEDLDMFLNVDEKMEPEIAERIDEIIRKNGLQKRVHVFSPEQLPQTGRGSHIFPDLLKTSRVFLTMSVMEGFGMAACEAAACGVPVVGTDQIPVVTDILEPAGGGKVVPAKDVDVTAEAVLDILRKDEDDYCAMQKRAYNAVIPRFAWDTIMKGMFEQMEDKGIRLRLKPKQNGNGAA